MQAEKRSTRDSGAWRPDARVSVGIAFGATLVVMLGFAALFSAVPKLILSRDTDRVREQLVFAEPLPTLPTPRLRAHLSTAARPLPLLQDAWPPLPVPIAAPGGFSTQDYLEQRRQQNAAALQDQVTGSDLKRKLDKLVERQALPENQSYHTVDGQKVVRTGGGCAEIHTVQGSSSPTNRVDVAAPISCPGSSPDASREIGKALEEWAKKVHLPQPPPPGDA